MNNTENIQERELDLDIYFRAVFRAKFLIAKSIGFTLGLAILYLFLAPPMYLSNTLVKTAPPAPIPVSVTQRSSASESGELIDDVLANIEILTSRMVLGRVVDAMLLDIEAEPHYFPIIGSAVSRFLDVFDEDPEDLRDPLFGMTKYAWGGEAIEVDLLEVPDVYMGESFDLIALGSGRYEILDSEEEVFLNGKTGEIATGQVTLPNGRKGNFRIRVNHLVGRPGTEFSVARLSWITTVTELQEEIEVIELAPNSGLIDLSLEGADPEKTAAILNKVVQVYMEKDVNRKLTELQQRLAFIQNQIPDAKKNLQSAEEELSLYQSEYGGLDINLETSTLLDQLKEVQDLSSAVELLRIDYQNTYTKQHPNLVSLENKSIQLEKRKRELEAQLANLPRSEIIATNVERNVEIASEIYLVLLQMQQELNLAIAAVGSTIWVVDEASIPDETSSPLYLLVPLIAIVFGGLVGLALALFTKRNVEVVEVPSDLEKLGLPIQPLPSAQMSLFRYGMMLLHKLLPWLFAPVLNPVTVKERALRSLRDSLIMDGKAKPSTVLLCHMTAETNPSSLIQSLIPLLETTSRTVIVDLDLTDRALSAATGHLHSPGLVEVVIDGAPLEECLKQEEHGSLSFLSAGRPLNDPTAVFVKEEFKTLLSQLSTNFDLIILDSAPLSNTLDAFTICRTVKTRVILEVPSAQFTGEEISSVMYRFRSFDNEAESVLLTNVPVGLTVF